LESIQLPEGLKTIGTSAFRNTALKSVSFPSTLESVGQSAFFGCASLETIEFNENLKEIKQNTFDSCSALKELHFNEGLESIEPFAFVRCDALESVVFPASLKTLGEQSFREDKNLKKVEFLGGNELAFNSWVFYGDTALETVIIGDGVTAFAFSGCTALKNVQLPSTITKISTEAFRATSLEEIEIPASVESIGDYAFWGCENLKTVKLNEGLKTIERNAFWTSGIEELVIPSTVEKIGGQAFDSSSFKKITFLRKDIPISVWTGIPRTCVICGYTGSTAQTFAEENGYTFEALDAESAPEILLGDADQNGEVDILDVISINKAILGKENLSENGLKAIDFNGNEKPDSDEAMQVLKFIVGMIENFNA
ncbi:MAG: leucine-rich repeat protein, partial [Oscillospiraceae bacterium]|nr:leucine-rich repeat protein [Oscillospiraceae bacterium]